MRPTTTIPNVKANDGGAGTFAPTTTRRLFDLSRESSPVEVGGRGRPPRVVFSVPFNGSGRDDQPGFYPSGNVTQVVHAPACCFARWPCSGPPECESPRPPAELSPVDLTARIADLEYYVRTREAGDPVDDAILPVRLAELETLRGELAARETMDNANA